MQPVRASSFTPTARCGILCLCERMFDLGAAKDLFATPHHGG